MKKILLGLIIGGLITLPVSVSAWTSSQIARPIAGVDCRDTYATDKEGKYIKDKNGKKVLTKDCSTTVHTIEYEGYRCFISKGTNAGGISCLKN